VEVKRINRLRYELTFSNNEAVDMEQFALADNKAPDTFIKWLLRVGLEIYRLTIK